MRTMTINNKTFQVIKPRAEIEAFEPTYRDLFYYYGRPSDTKRAIYSEWLHWALECPEVSGFGVTGANCNFFSLGFLVELEGHLYNAVVTASNNKLYQVY